MTQPSGTALADLLVAYDAARAYSIDLINGLEPDQIAWRPHENSSAIAWHLGHQAAVNHFMVRNLTVAEPTFNADFDALFDSANPEPSRGTLPSLDEIADYRVSVANSTKTIIGRIQSGNVGAPHQLLLIGEVLLRALINHEYQHAAWILEVRDTMIDVSAPQPTSDRVTLIDGYWTIPTA